MYAPSFDVDAVVRGAARLTGAQALELLQRAPLHDLAEWADAVALRLHPEPFRTYVVDRNVNYTNVCTSKCTFCGFRRDHEDADSYVLSHAQVGAKLDELVAIGGTSVLMQGGMNDRLPIGWYEDLLQFISERYPQIHLHAFSPPEFVEFERFWGMDVRDILRRFIAAGLKSVPGGGGEIFAPRVRRKIGHVKCSGADWLRVMRVAHEEGLNTSATMMMGHIETVAERVEHMSAVRAMQDYALALPAGGDMSALQADVEARYPGVFTKSPATGHPPLATGSYLAFIHWPFQRENVPLGRAAEYDPAVHGDFDALEHPDVIKGRVVRTAGATEYLRTLAVARLYFDNVPNLQSSWVTMGPEVGQLALRFGANDMGGAMMEENVVSAAGTTYRLAVRDLCRMIRDAGWTPAQRTQRYGLVRVWDGPDAPDLVPEADPPVRKVERLADKAWIGAAPGLEDVKSSAITTDGPDESRRLALNVLS